MQSRSSDSVKKRSSSSVGALPIDIDANLRPDGAERQRPGPRPAAAMSRLKNSITPRTSPSRSIGMAKALCRPTRAGDGAAREVVVPAWMSGIHAGWPAAHTRPGRPVPRANDDLAGSRRRTPRNPSERCCQLSTHRNDRTRAIHFPERAVLPAERGADGRSIRGAASASDGSLRERACRLVHHQPVQDPRVLQRISPGRQRLSPSQSPHRAVASGTTLPEFGRVPECPASARSAVHHALPGTCPKPLIGHFLRSGRRARPGPPAFVARLPVLSLPAGMRSHVLRAHAVPASDRRRRSRAAACAGLAAQRRGYEVEQAADGAEALRTCCAASRPT